MSPTILIAGWLLLSAACALGVAIISDRVLGTFTIKPRLAPVRGELSGPRMRPYRRSAHASDETPEARAPGSRHSSRGAQEGGVKRVEVVYGTRRQLRVTRQTKGASDV